MAAGHVDRRALDVAPRRAERREAPDPRGRIAAAAKRTLRTLLTKPGWNSLEIRTLRGVLSAFRVPRPRS